jgi:hypothetical protein
MKEIVRRTRYTYTATLVLLKASTPTTSMNTRVRKDQVCGFIKLKQSSS